MKLNKQQKQFVIHWIEHQFRSNNLFPSQSDSDKKVDKHHLQAYKAWTKTPHKKTYIGAWVNEWLSDEQRKRLDKAMKKHVKTDEDD